MVEDTSIPVFISGNSIGEIRRVVDRMRGEHRKGSPRYPMAPYFIYAEIVHDIRAADVYRIEKAASLKRKGVIHPRELVLCGDEISEPMRAEIRRAIRRQTPIVCETESMSRLLKEFRRALRTPPKPLQALAA